jgi:histidyl-tRNA synthetase
MFSNKQIPSTGGSIGIERIFNILEMRAEREHAVPNKTFAFVGTIGKIDTKVLFEVSNWLWQERITSEIFYEDIKPSEQFSIAASKGGQCFVLLGESELH